MHYVVSRGGDLEARVICMSYECRLILHHIGCSRLNESCRVIYTY